MIALAVAVASVGVASAADTSGQNESFLKVGVSPSKLSKKKFKAVKLFVDTSSLNKTDPGTPTSPGVTPVPTTDVKLKFDKDLKFTSKGLAQCSTSKIGNATSDQARSACKNAMVGKGSAYACVVGGNPGVPCTPGSQGGVGFKQTVSAFNGKPKGGKPTIVLHSWSTGLPVPTVLVGTLDKKSNTLNVPLPPAVYNLATITDFKTTVQKSFKSKGKKYNYVSARCKKGKIPLKGKFTYLGSEPVDNEVSEPSCKS
jgi:hypothetical protein